MSTIYIYCIHISTHYRYAHIHPPPLSTFTYIGRPHDEVVALTIENSTTVLVGEVVEIQCRYSGERIAFKLPAFYINGKTNRLESVGTIWTELSDYEHRHSLAIEEGKWTASYTLTLKGARASDDNTIYQCFSEVTEGRHVTRVWSDPVTLTVIGEQNII